MNIDEVLEGEIDMEEPSFLKSTTTPGEEFSTPAMSNDTNDHEANGIASNGNHETSPDLNGHFDQRQVANKDNKEPRVEPLVLKRSVLQQKQRWSCKEELSFYRTLVSIGIQKSADDDETILWDEFRQTSKLDKSDEVLSEYYHAFIAMCKRTVGLPLQEAEEVPQVHIEAITKEKALNVLKKIQELPDEDRNETKPDQNRRILQKAADKDSREPETKSGQDKEPKPESIESEKPKPDQPEKTVPPLRINLLNLQKRTNGVEPETARSKKDEADLKAETKNPDPEISFSPDEQPEPEPEPEVEKSEDPPEMETEDVVAAEVDKDEHSEPEAAQLESDDLAKKSVDRSTPSPVSTTSSDADLTAAAMTSSTSADPDKSGLQKRKLSGDSREEKSKKKKRLDDIMLGLGASKGVDLDHKDDGGSKKSEQSASNGKSEHKTPSNATSSSSKVPELNKLKELLCRTDLMPEPRSERPKSAADPSHRGQESSKAKESGQNYGFDLKALQSLSNMNEKMFPDYGQKTKSPSLSESEAKAAAAFDEAAMMRAFGLDPKILQSMGISLEQLMKLDPNLMQLFNSAPKQAAAPMPSPTASAKKAPAPPPASDKNKFQQEMMAAAAMMGLDPKKMDPAMLSALGMNMHSLDMWTMAALGMDPKNPGASFGGMDPALLNAMCAQQFSNMAGLGKMSPSRSHSPASSKTSRATPSPKQSHSSKGDSYRPSSRSSAPSPKSHDPRSSYSSLYGDLSITNMSGGGGSNKNMHEQKSSFTDPKLYSALNKPDPKMGGTSSLKGMNAIDQLQSMLSLPGVDPRALALADPKLFEAAGLDPKLFNRGHHEKPKEQPMPKLTPGYDPKMMKGLDPKLFDPKLMQGLDPRLFAGFDPKMFQGMSGFDPNFFAAMNSKPQMSGFDPKHMGGLDPKLFAGIDPKLLAGLDPKLMAGLDPKLMQSMMGFDPNMFGMNPKLMDPKFLGFDPKFLAGMDPKMLAAMDPMMGHSSSFMSDRYSPKSSSSGSMSAPPSSSANSLDPRLNGLDPKLLQGLDAKTLQSLGLDPNLVASVLNSKNTSSPARSSPSTMSSNFPRLSTSKPSASATSTTNSSQSKASSAAAMLGLDPKLAAAYGIDLNLLAGLDPKFLQGLDPKLLGFDPNLLAGLNSPAPKPKQAPSPKPSSSSYDSNPFSAMDQKLMEMNSRMMASPSAMSPKSSSSRQPQNMGSKPSSSDMKSPSGHETKKKQAFDAKMMAGMDPFMMAGLDPKLLAGLDPKFFAGFDPKAMAGLDPKMLSSFDSKLMAGLDPKLLSGFDPKSMGGIDPKLLAGLDPKFLSGFDPKAMAGLDPKMLSSFDSKLMAGLDPKLLAGLDPKLFAGLDPKMLMAGLDPKLLAGFDPKMMAGLSGFNPMPSSKSQAESESSKSSKLPPGVDPALAAMFGGWGMPPAGLGASSTVSRPKPGTVAAALEEKKARTSMDFSNFMFGSGFGKDGGSPGASGSGSATLDGNFLSKFDSSPAMNLSKRKSDDDSGENLSKKRHEDQA